jgi:hypothetical protein
MKPGPSRGGWLLGAVLVAVLLSLAGGFAWFRVRRAWLRPPPGMVAVCILVEGPGQTELDLRPVNVAAATAMNAARQYRWSDFTWRTATPFRPAYIQYFVEHDAAFDPRALWSHFVPTLRHALKEAENAPPCRFAVVDGLGNVVGLDP